MNANSSQKCRTCLKSSEKTVPLTKQATGCNPKRTYGQVLKELAIPECSVDYEYLMPQYLCLLCCRGLRNTYAFIKQAQYCNNKLIRVIAKQLNCLQEKTIDLPQNANNLDKSFEIILENDAKTEECSNNDANIQLEVSRDIKIPKHIDGNGENKMFEFNQNNSSVSPLTSCWTSDNEKKTLLKINTEDSSKSQIELPCPICEKHISGHDNLIKHLRTQHDIEDISNLLYEHNLEPKEEFSCKLCSCKYTNKNIYLYHLKLKHSIDEKKTKEEKGKVKIIKCRLCDYTARTYAALNYHNRSKHGTVEDKFKCKFCANMYLKKFDLMKHIQNSHKQQIKTLKAEAKQKEDQREASNDVSIVAAPKLSPIQKQNSQDNEDSSSDDIPLSKTINKTYTASNSLYNEDEEQLSEEEFIRNILNIKKRQTKSSTKSLARRCDECGNVYKNYGSLYAHQRHVHISEDKYSLCPHCGKKYKRKIDLRTHIEKVHISKNATQIAKQSVKAKEKRFMCTECSYVCGTITVLNIHINRHHTGEKPYKCDICFKSFVVRFDLKIHSYIHTGERPYKCPICSKGFRDSSHMLKHKRIHSSERPYKCKECSKTFTQSYNLSVHKRMHLKEKKLNCLTCDKVFESISLLNMHRINENHHDEVI